jgi:hypothetical protein
MSAADQRLAELLRRWLVSLDLHLRYVELDDATYWAVQPWPRHERPSKWVLEIAKQKVLELKAVCEARRGDEQFAEALESMAFLANLVGLQHIQRFIPLASEHTDATVEAPTLKPTPAPAKAAGADDATREMPRLKIPGAKPVSQPAPKAPGATASKAPDTPQAARPHPKKAQTHAPKGPVPVPLTPAVQTKIIADAVRLLKWGKQWHELAETIARIAERPPVGDIRKVLRSHRAEIESKAAKAAR